VIVFDRSSTLLHHTHGGIMVNHDQVLVPAESPEPMPSQPPRK
jgi:hypothetical protein